MVANMYYMEVPKRDGETTGHIKAVAFNLFIHLRIICKMDLRDIM